jgi:hypothetical protein
MVIYFKYGFMYKEVQYGWNNKKLYRLPYMKNNKSYGFKEIPFYCFKTTIIYNVQRTKLTINRLKIITTPIDVKIEIIESSDCPF